MKKTALKIVKAQGRGSLSSLAKYLGKTTDNMSTILRKNRPTFENQILITKAINELFNKKYEREDLFPPSL